MESVLYLLSDRFHGFLFQQEDEAEPVLVVDQTVSDIPRRLFSVRYILGQGAGGEASRPIFRSELTAYDCETKTMYPTQTLRLEKLQGVMESAMYGQPENSLGRVTVQAESTVDRRPVKVIVSEALFAKLVGLYEYAW